MSCRPLFPVDSRLVLERVRRYTRLVRVVCLRRPPPPRPQVKQLTRTPKKLTTALTIPVMIAPMPLMTAMMPVAS